MSTETTIEESAICDKLDTMEQLLRECCDETGEEIPPCGVTHISIKSTDCEGQETTQEINVGAESVTGSDGTVITLGDTSITSSNNGFIDGLFFTDVANPTRMYNLGSFVSIAVGVLVTLWLANAAYTWWQARDDRREADRRERAAANRRYIAETEQDDDDDSNDMLKKFAMMQMLS